MASKPLSRALPAGLILCLLTTAASAQSPTGQPTFPTNEQMRHYKQLGSPRLSPDGKRVLFNLRESTADGAKSHLWMIDVDGGEARQLTFSPDADKRGEHGGEWMPDGASVLFLAKRGEHTELYRLPMDGGEAKPFALKVEPVVDDSKRADALPPAKADDRAEKPKDPEEIAIDVGDFEVSPDGKRIAITAEEPETPGEKKNKDAKADADWVDHSTHGTTLFLLDVATGKLTRTGVPRDVGDASWSRDGSRLLVLSEEPNGVGDLHPAATAWSVAPDDAVHPQKLTGLPPTVGAALWSGDGKSVVYLAKSAVDAPPGYSDVYVVPVTGSNTRNLTGGFTGSVEGREPLALSGGEVDVLATSGVNGVLLRYLPGKDTPEILQLPVPFLAEAETNQAESGWVFLGSGGGHAPGLFYAAKLGEHPRLLKTPSTVPENTRIVAPKLVHWEGERVAGAKGKLTVEGLLYLPPEASATHKVPLVVDVHGGPLGGFSDGFSPYIDFLLGQGWAVLRPNPRGSTGHGVAFAAANKNDLGGADYRDIMAGVDAVLKTEPLDETRLALIGYSYGGEMAGFVEGKTTRFKAIVSGAPVIDQYSEYGTERGSWYDRWYFGKPWEHPADAWRQSPLSGAAHAKTPFLLLQGDADRTDPLGQSLEMYRALKQEGVPVEMVTYPREDHGPLAGGMMGAPSPEPWHGYDARRRLVEFIRKGFGEAPQ